MQATIVTLNRCAAMVALLKNASGPYADRVQKIENILSDPQLEKLRNIDIYKSLSLRTLAVYDHLLKSKFSAEMEEILLFIHELDVYIAVSDVARQRGFTYAKAYAPEKNMLQAVDLAHPCIVNGVGNNIRMEENSNVLFLTGGQYGR